MTLNYYIIVNDFFYLIIVI